MSKNIIFYFTGTGNSLKVARDIAKTKENCEVKLVTNFKDKSLSSGYDSIGFVFPIYASNMPNYFIKFLANVDFNENKNSYFYAIGTYGNSSGNSFFVANKLLERQGLKLNGAFGIKMFSNNVVLYNMKGDPIKKNEDASVIISEIAKKIDNKETTDIPKKSKLFGKLLSDFASKGFAEKDKNFNISEDCNGCSICSKVCPVQNIEMSNNKPTFTHKCEQCLSCIQNCPSKAINYKNTTQKRKRYINPEIKVGDLFTEGK